MRGNETLWRALARARRSNLDAGGVMSPRAGPTGETRRAVLLALGAGGLAAALPRRAAAASPAGPVAIVGGGIAGLSALWHLTQAGIEARLYEARPRLGGRMYTVREPGHPALEMGGQLVNSDHADVQTLAEAFGVGLVERKAAPHRTLILDGGRVVPEEALATGLRGIAGQIDADAVRLDRDYAGVAPELDAMSFTGYLDRHAALLPEPWVRGLLEATARSEYGVEPGEASAIELVFNLPAVDGARIEVLSHSDERYVIAGGSGALIDAMAARLDRQIATNRRVVRIDPLGAGVRLVFADGRTADAARVIVTTPASITRRIDLRTALPPLWRRFITEVGLGTVMKLHAGMTARPWEGVIGRGGELWQARGDFALGWDGSVRPAGGNVWTWFLGGAQVAASAAHAPETLARRFAAQVERGVAGMTAATGGYVRTSRWHRDPLTLGGYVNFRPGQLTRFAPLVWTEADGVARPPLPSGAVSFAGEHLSDAFPGYMNGAAQTGRLAAQAIIGGVRMLELTRRRA